MSEEERAQHHEDVVNIGIGFFVVKNDIDEDHLRKRRGKR
jgi:hypothetical protein